MKLPTARIAFFNLTEWFRNNEEQIRDQELSAPRVLAMAKKSDPDGLKFGKYLHEGMIRDAAKSTGITWKTSWPSKKKPTTKIQPRDIVVIATTLKNLLLSFDVKNTDLDEIISRYSNDKNEKTGVAANVGKSEKEKDSD